MYNLEALDIRNDINNVRLYCNNCGKICSNLLPKEKILEWITSPYCFDCCLEKILLKGKSNAKQRNT